MTDDTQTEMWIIQLVIGVLSVWDAEFSRKPLSQQIDDAQWVLSEWEPVKVEVTE